MANAIVLVYHDPLEIASKLGSGSCVIYTNSLRFMYPSGQVVFFLVGGASFPNFLAHPLEKITS